MNASRCECNVIRVEVNILVCIVHICKGDSAHIFIQIVLFLLEV